LKVSADTILCCTHSFTNEVSAAIDLPARRKKYAIESEKNKTLKLVVILNGICAVFCLAAFVLDHCIKLPETLKIPDSNAFSGVLKIPDTARPSDRPNEDKPDFNST